MKESSKEIWKPMLNFIYFLIQSYGGNTRYCDTLADNTLKVFTLYSNSTIITF